MMICRSYRYVCMCDAVVRVGISWLFFLLSFIVYSMQATTRSNFKGITITNFTFTLLEFRPNIRPSPIIIAAVKSDSCSCSSQKRNLFHLATSHFFTLAFPLWFFPLIVIIMVYRNSSRPTTCVESHLFPLFSYYLGLVEMVEWKKDFGQ